MSDLWLESAFSAVAGKIEVPMGDQSRELRTLNFPRAGSEAAGAQKSGRGTSASKNSESPESQQPKHQAAALAVPMSHVACALHCGAGVIKRSEKRGEVGSIFPSTSSRSEAPH